MLQLIISPWKHWFPCYFFNVDADSYHRVSTSLSVALESFTLRKKRKITKSPLSYLCSDVSSLKEYSAHYLISNCYPNIMHIKYLVCVSVCVCVVIQSCPTLWDPVNCSLPGPPCPQDYPGKNTEVGCYLLFQGHLLRTRIQPESLALKWILYPWVT